MISLPSLSALFSLSPFLVSFSSSFGLLPSLALPSALSSVSSTAPLAGPGGVSLSSPAISSPSAFPSAAGAGVGTGVAVAVSNSKVAGFEFGVLAGARIEIGVGAVVVVLQVAGAAVSAGADMVAVVVVVVVVT